MKRASLLFCSLFFVFSALIAQDISTPRRAVENHLANLQEDQYYPGKAVASFNFSGSQSMADKKELAVKLKQIFDGNGWYIDIDGIPDKKIVVDSTSDQMREYFIPSNRSIYLEKYGDKWQYSKETVAKIGKMHRELYPFGAAWLSHLLPSNFQTVILGLHGWQWVSIVALFLLAFVFYYLVRNIAANLLIRYIEKLGKQHLSGEKVRRAMLPLSAYLVIYVVRIFLPTLLLPVSVAHYVNLGLGILLPIIGVFVFYRLVDILIIYLEKITERTESKMDDQLLPIVNKGLKGLVIVGGFIVILQNLNVNTTGLLAGLSIGGLALALAAQDTVKNLIGSMTIFVDKPFQIGDWVTADGIDGTVEEVGFRSSRIRTFRNSQLYVPNGKLADMITDNNGKREYRRYYTRIAITYDTPPQKIQMFVEGLRKIVEQNKYTVNDMYHVYLNEFGDSALEILFYIFFNVPDWGKELEARHHVILEVIELAEILDVRFAFPTQTIHIEDLPGQDSLTPIHHLEEGKMNDQIKAFFERKGKLKAPQDNSENQ